MMVFVRKQQNATKLSIVYAEEQFVCLQPKMVFFGTMIARRQT